MGLGQKVSDASAEDTCFCCQATWRATTPSSTTCPVHQFPSALCQAPPGSPAGRGPRGPRENRDPLEDPASQDRTDRTGSLEREVKGRGSPSGLFSWSLWTRTRPDVYLSSTRDPCALFYLCVCVFRSIRRKGRQRISRSWSPRPPRPSRTPRYINPH